MLFVGQYFLQVLAKFVKGPDAFSSLNKLLATKGKYKGPSHSNKVLHRLIWVEKGNSYLCKDTGGTI